MSTFQYFRYIFGPLDQILRNEIFLKMQFKVFLYKSDGILFIVGTKTCHSS